MTAAVIKKKVRPYPIQVLLTGKAGVLRGQIIKLVTKGFIVNLNGQVVHVHEVLQLAFEIPVIHHSVKANGVVIKTYDRVNPEHGTERLAEIHFAQISDEDKKGIHSFLLAIRQADE